MTSMRRTTFEAVPPGTDLPDRTIGPLTTSHLMRWSAAIENWHRIHYDAAFATEHDGLPGLLISGSLKQQLILSNLKDWAGPGGWVCKVRFEFRAMNVVGETLTLWARTTAAAPGAGFGLVRVELGIRGAQGRESTPGTAVVALPFADGPDVPYPFPERHLPDVEQIARSR